MAIWRFIFLKNKRSPFLSNFFLFFLEKRARTLFIQVSPHSGSPVSGLKGAIYFNVEQLKGW